MLIIPAESAVNWKRPPWMTLSLILACFLAFAFYQGDDDRIANEALETYLNADLQSLEAPAYEDYLQRKIRLEGQEELVSQLEGFNTLQEQNEQVWIAATLLFDNEFYQYLLENRELIWTSNQRRAWMAQRSEIQREYINRLSSNQLGLVPAQLSLYTLVTYQFLHGGWGHIIGNLVFLFLLGFTVEKALGAARFLLAYLACGAISGLVFTAFSLGSTVPLVGASGSISGLMGMYVAIYGLQKIRFFYFVGVYLITSVHRRLRCCRSGWVKRFMTTGLPGQRASLTWPTLAGWWPGQAWYGCWGKAGFRSKRNFTNRKKKSRTSVSRRATPRPWQVWGEWNSIWPVSSLKL